MATFNSSLINVGGGQANPSVYPGTARPVIGSVTIASGTTIAINDTMPLFYQNGPACHIYSFWLDFPALDGGTSLTLSLLDSNTSPTTIVNASTTGRAGGWLDETNAVDATLGAAIKYTAQSLVYLKAAAGATNSVGGTAVVIYFGFLVTQD